VKLIVKSMLVLTALLSGCALTSRSEPLQVRYFSADSARQPPAQPVGSAPQIGLRLDRVRSSSHLGEAIAYRSSEYEVGYYDIERWTERPEAFLERGLDRALFQEYGLRRVIAGASEALSVELVSFEEVRGSKPVARLEAIITLHDERTSHLEQTLRLEQPIAQGDGKDPAARAVAALSAVLAEAIDKIARMVAERLTAVAAAEAAPAAGPPAVSVQEPARDSLR